MSNLDVCRFWCSWCDEEEMKKRWRIDGGLMDAVSFQDSMYDIITCIMHKEKRQKALVLIGYERIECHTPFVILKKYLPPYSRVRLFLHCLVSSLRRWGSPPFFLQQTNNKIILTFSFSLKLKRHTQHPASSIMTSTWHDATHTGSSIFINKENLLFSLPLIAVCTTYVSEIVKDTM